MTDADLDTLLQKTTWPQFVEDVLTRIVAELPRRSTGSANALLGAVLKHLYERGAMAALNHNQHEADEGEITATRH
jgi:hypothetical protein